MRKWPNEVVEWLRDNIQGRTTKEVTRLINQQGFDKKYGMTFTEPVIKSAKSRYHLKSGTPGGFPKGYSPKYPEGMEEFIRGIATGKSTEELVTAVNNRFGDGTIKINQMRAYKKNHNINTGLDRRFKPGHIPANKGTHPQTRGRMAETQFKKGGTPLNHLPVGSVRVRNSYKGKKPYVWEKVAEPNVWRMKHVIEWESHNGPIPRDKIVIFADGDTLNTDISNLVLVSRSQHAIMNRWNLKGSSKELTEAAANVANVKLRLSKIRKSKKKKER